MGNILVITDNLNAPPWYFCLDRYRHDIHWTGSGKNGEESKQVHFYFCKHIAAFCQASTQKQMHLHRYTKKPLKIQGFHRAADGNRTRKIQRFYAVCRLRVAFRVAYFRRWYFIYISVRVKFWRFYIELESSMYQTSNAPLSWLCQHAPSNGPSGVGSK